MAQSKAKKSGASGAKRPAAKPVAKSAKKPVAAKRPAPKPAPAKKGKPVAKKAGAPVKKAARKAAPAKAAKAPAKKAGVQAKTGPKSKPMMPKPAPKAVVVPAPKSAPALKAAPAPKAPPAPVLAPAATKPAPKRAVAVSHRPQTAAVAVQTRPAKKGAAPTGRTGGAILSTSTLTEDQVRRASDADYMSDDQLSFFNDRLMQMRSEVLARELDVKERLHQREVFADPADRASAEEEHWLDLRLRERESLLLKKIDDALRRIRDKEYGYCEKTGEPIGIARLLARPTATVCVDIKGQDERAESQYRDR